jgi:hypothetical protein
MNIYQRIVLILGAIILVVAIWTTPRFYIFDGDRQYTNSAFIKMIEEKRGSKLPIDSELDIADASMRAVTVLGVTILLCAALKGIIK